jgi:hypothetical protein
VPARIEGGYSAIEKRREMTVFICLKLNLKTTPRRGEKRKRAAENGEKANKRKRGVKAVLEGSTL